MLCCALSTRSCAISGGLHQHSTSLLFAGVFLAMQRYRRGGTKRGERDHKSRHVVVQDLLLALQQNFRVRKGRSHDTPGPMARLTSPTSLLAMGSAPTLMCARDMLFLQDK